MKKIFNYILLFLIGILVLYFSLKDDYDTIINTIIHMNYLLLLITLIFYLLYIFFKNAVLYLIAQKFNPKYNLLESFRLGLETSFFHAITPFSSGGQPYEIYRLNKSGLNIIEASNVSIQNFIVYQIVLVLLGLFAIIYNSFTGIFDENNVIRGLVFLGFSINFLVIIFLFIITYTKKSKGIITRFIIKILSKLKIIKNKEYTLNKFDSYLKEFDISARTLLKDKKYFLSLFFLELIAMICYYITPLIVIYACHITSVHMINSIVASAYVMILGSFVPIPGGTGGIEYGFVKFYGRFIMGSSLNAIMLVWRFITYYFSMILGLICLIIRKKA